jgi:hypothetical protein
MFSGGAGIINLNGKFFHGQESGDTITRTQIIPQKKILKDFMDRLDINGLSRYTGLKVASGLTSCRCIAETGKQYAVYLYHAAPDKQWGSSFVPEPGNYCDTLTINSVPAGTYVTEWIDPLTGSVKSSEIMNYIGGELKLITPFYPLDIALKITSRK